MNWEEASRYILQSQSGPTFKIKIEDGRVSYFILDAPEEEEETYSWQGWCMASEDNEYYLKSYTIVGDNPDAGPPLSQEDKICRKIKLMEKRWISFQERKQHVQCRG